MNGGAVVKVDTMSIDKLNIALGLLPSALKCVLIHNVDLCLRNLLVPGTLVFSRVLMGRVEDDKISVDRAIRRRSRIGIVADGVRRVEAVFDADRLLGMCR